MAGRLGEGWANCKDEEEMAACSSGLLDMIAEALLIFGSSGFVGAADVLLTGAGDGDAFRCSAVLVSDLTLCISADCLCGERDFDGAGGLKASSASCSAARCLKSAPVGDDGLSKSNFEPWSCRSENWSSVGNLDESSSAVALGPDFESNAAKGSPFVTRRGDGLGLATGCAGGAFETAGGLPRLIGTTSGIFCSCCGGGENTAPTTGVVLPFWSGAGCCLDLPGSDWERFE